MRGDRATRHSFHRSRAPHQRAIDEAWTRSQGSCVYLGEWHTHPEPDPHPSTIDLDDWRRRLREDDVEAPYLFFVIVGQSRISAWEGSRTANTILSLPEPPRTTGLLPPDLSCMEHPMNPIVIAQTWLFSVSREDAERATGQPIAPEDFVELDLKAVSDEAKTSGDWRAAAEETRRLFREKLLPRMQVRPSAPLAYFGSAPIPLAMLLGRLIGSAPRLSVYQRHHDTKEWGWTAESQAPEVLLKCDTDERHERIEGDAILRLSSTVLVSEDESRAAVTSPIAIEADVKLDAIHRDTITNEAVLRRVASLFREGLDRILDLRPKVHTVHVFATAPAGLAFLMGTEISPNYHPAIQTYFFDSQRSPKQVPACLLAEAIATNTVPQLDEETLVAERKLAANEFEHVHNLAITSKEEAGKGKTRKAKVPSWLSFTLPEPKDAAPFVGTWCCLPAIHELPAATSAFSLEQNPGDGFAYDPRKRTWSLSASLMGAFLKRFPDREQRARVLRMFFFHEVIHGAHRLTTATSRGIGRFPRVLEELDYQADVWGMLHELKHTRSRQAARFANGKGVREEILAMIDLALETYAAFDDGPGPMTRIQVRRMNRYMIWCWQSLMVENADDQDVYAALADKPLLELAGPSQFTQDERVFFDLTSTPRRLELAVLHQNVLRRFASGEGGPVDLGQLLAHLRTRNVQGLKDSLRGAMDALV